MDWTSILVGVAVLTGGAFIFLSTWRRSREVAAAKAAQTSINYPLRLQAAERMILFLERIKPQSILTRLGVEFQSPTELQQMILQEIRKELDHNVAQQLYLRKATWEKINLAATTTSAALVHGVAVRSTSGDVRSIVVQLLQNEDETVNRLIQEALDAIKEEVQENF